MPGRGCRRRTVHRLRQELDRGLRHPTDDVNGVILNPRFPSPSDTSAGEGLRRHARSLDAMPPRFLAAYRGAHTT